MSWAKTLARGSQCSSTRHPQAWTPQPRHSDVDGRGRIPAEYTGILQPDPAIHLHKRLLAINYISIIYLILDAVRPQLDQLPALNY